MKLGQLNSAIRDTSKVYVRYRFGAVPQEKTALIEALKSHFTEGKAQETGLCPVEIDGKSFLQWETGHEAKCGSCGAIL